MPTENRSSNTEMVSVPLEPTREMLAAALEVDGIFPRWRAMVAAAPTQQHWDEPVAIVNVEKPGNVEWLVDPTPSDATELYTRAHHGEAERLNTVIERQKNLIASLRAELVESRGIDTSAEQSAPTWSCQPCQLEQPTDRPCDACGGQTALIAAKS